MKERTLEPSDFYAFMYIIGSMQFLTLYHVVSDSEIFYLIAGIILIAFGFYFFFSSKFKFYANYK